MKKIKKIIKVIIFAMISWLLINTIIVLVVYQTLSYYEKKWEKDGTITSIRNLFSENITRIENIKQTIYENQ